MVGKILTTTTVGFDGQIIEVESDANKGLPSLQIVGMGNKAIDEAKERVRSAINNSLLEFPTKKLLSIWLQPSFLRTVRSLTCRLPYLSWLSVVNYVNRRSPARFLSANWRSTATFGPSKE